MACHTCANEPIDRQIKCAAEHGHLDCLRHLRKQGCPWNEYTPAYAAHNGHLSCLQYLKEQGCPWNDYAPYYAAHNRHFHCLRYLSEQGCPWSESTTKAVACIAKKPLAADEIDMYMNLLCDLVNCQAPGYQRILDMPLYIEYCNASSPWLK